MLAKWSEACGPWWVLVVKKKKWPMCIALTALAKSSAALGGNDVNGDPQGGGSGDGDNLSGANWLPHRKIRRNGYNTKVKGAQATVISQNELVTATTTVTAPQGTFRSFPNFQTFQQNFFCVFTIWWHIQNPFHPHCVCPLIFLSEQLAVLPPSWLAEESPPLALYQ